MGPKGGLLLFLRKSIVKPECLRTIFGALLLFFKKKYSKAGMIADNIWGLNCYFLQKSILKPELLLIYFKK